MRKALIHSVWHICLILLLQACGMYSFTGASISPEVKSISIDFFPNQAEVVNPTLSQTFTEGLKDHFLQQTNLILKRDEGDLHFEGEIVQYSIKPVASTAEQNTSQNRLTIAVRVRFYNKFDEDKNFDTRFSRFADFPSSQNIASIEEELVAEIVQELEENIFNKALVNW